MWLLSSESMPHIRGINWQDEVRAVAEDKAIHSHNDV